MSTFSTVASPIRIDNNIGAEYFVSDVSTLPTQNGFRVASLFTVPADKYAILSLVSVESASGNSGVTTSSPSFAQGMGLDLVSFAYSPGSDKQLEQFYIPPGKTVYFLTTAFSGVARVFINGVLFKNA